MLHDSSRRTIAISSPHPSVLRYVADQLSGVLEIAESRCVVGDAVDDVVSDIGGSFDASPDDLGGISLTEVYSGVSRRIGFVLGGDSA